MESIKVFQTIMVEQTFFLKSVLNSISWMKTNKYEKMSEALFIWFYAQRRKSISGPKLKEKSTDFVKSDRQRRVEYSSKLRIGG